MKQKRPEDRVPDFAILANEYVTITAARVGRSHAKNICRVLNELNLCLGGELPTRSEISRWRDTMEPNLAPATVVQAMGIASSFCNWLLEREKLDYNPCQGVRRPRGKQVRPMRAFTEEELAAVLAAARELDKERGTIYRMEWVLRGLAETGMRFGAFSKVRWRDIQLKRGAGAIHVRAETTKTKAARVIPLRDEYTESLNQMLEDLTKAHGNHYKTDSTVWRTIKGKPFLKGSAPAWSYLQRSIKRAGVARHDAEGAGLTIHSFRHTAVTRLLRSGANHSEVMAIMGHKTPGITLGTYNQTTGEDGRGAIERLPSLEANHAD